MTEVQARTKLQKLLAITLDRGAAPGEQANATRAIGALLQEFPHLRDMITGVEDAAVAPSEESSGTFWKGVLVGAGAVVSTLGVLLLSALFSQGSNNRQ
jgi:hypothetical protein